MSRRRAREARQAGFTLLEAIVAMVLISTAGLALFGWINGNLISLSRVQDANARSEATVNILEYMQRVNPMLAPDGQADLGRYSIRWKSEPTTPVAEGVDHPRGRSLYQLALYRTTVAVRSLEGGPWFELKMQQVGYRKVRSGTQVN